MKIKFKILLSILAILGLSSCATNGNTTLSNVITTQPTVSPTTTSPAVKPTIEPTVVPTTEYPSVTTPSTTISQSTVVPTTITSIPTKPSVTVPTITSTATSTDPVVKDYYANVNTSLQGEAFISELTELINEGYIRKSYSQAYTILTESDVDLNDPSKIVCFYTGVSYPKGTSGSDRLWNREHTWAKSHGFSSESYDAYSDCHHLRATEMKINSTRGNLDFDEVENYNSSYSSDKYGNRWIGGKCFEPRDEVKGDVARIMLYMVTKYNDNILNLSLVDSIPTSGPKFGKFSTLLKWHYEDPVSEAEIYRNNIVYGYQNNRNPYIDHPEYVDIAFPNEYSSVDVDNAKVTIAEEKIAALPDTATIENKSTILNVKSYIDTNLNYAEIALVSNYSKLTSLLAQIEELESGSTEPTPNPDTEDYSYTFTSKVFSGNGIKNLNGIDWTLSGNGGYWGYTTEKGMQFGSANKPYTNLVLESEVISNKITKIVVETSGASGVSAKLTVFVNGVNVGSESITSTSKEYTFNVNSLSGKIKLNYDSSVAKALYIKTIKIYY